LSFLNSYGDENVQIVLHMPSPRAKCNFFNAKFLLNFLFLLFSYLISNIVRGYIRVHRYYQFIKSIPEEVLNFAYYVITRKFDKADEITLKEIQKGVGFRGIMLYCLVEQLKYRNRFFSFFLNTSNNNDRHY